MTYVQVKKPKVATSAPLGYCLWYVQEAFGTPHVGSNAWEAWTKLTKSKSTSKPPQGVFVPIWFDGYWDGHRYGHVAILYNGVVYSSPWDKAKGYSKLGSIAEVERIYGMKYVGWSRDVAGTTVIKKKEVKMPSEKEVIAMFKKWENRAPTAVELKQYSSKPWQYMMEKFLTALHKRIGYALKNKR